MSRVPFVELLRPWPESRTARRRVGRAWKAGAPIPGSLKYLVAQNQVAQNQVANFDSVYTPVGYLCLLQNQSEKENDDADHRATGRSIFGIENGLPDYRLCGTW